MSQLKKTSKPATIIKAWIKALRSGKYEQGRGTLIRDDEGPKYCCLGVLCDLAVKANVISHVPNEDYPPQSVVDWVGLTTASGRFKRKNSSSTLVNLNDTQKKSFRYIARVIERGPKGLFTTK